MEIELKAPLTQNATLQTNYSYVNRKDETGYSTPLTAKHLANLALSYKINSQWHTASKARYVGERNREIADDRNKLPQYFTLDQTLTFTHKAFSLQASAKNIFDEKVVFPSALGSFPNSGTYEEDFVRDGRAFWLSAQWKFE